MRRKRTTAIIGFSLALALWASVPAAAQATKEDPYAAIAKLGSQGRIITVQLAEADLKEMLEAVADAAGFELRIVGQLPEARHPAELKEASVADALRAIGRRGRLLYEVPDPDTLVVTARPRASQPKLISASHVPPVYPRDASENDIEGTVMVRAEVLPDGTVGEVVVVENESGFEPFEANAVAAVKQWRFEPAVREGKPVRVFVHMPVEFRLGSEPK